MKFKEKITLINEDILKVNEDRFNKVKMIFFGNFSITFHHRYL